MAKLPYYKRYPRDYLSDENVALMSLEEEGAYNRLMDYCWLQGSIPADVDKLAKLCRVSVERMEDIWRVVQPCFDDAGDGRLKHPRMEKERAEARGKSEQAAEAARIRWEREKAKTDNKPPQNDADALRAQSVGDADADADAMPYTESESETEVGTTTDDKSSDAKASPIEDTPGEMDLLDYNPEDDGDWAKLRVHYFAPLRKHIWQGNKPPPNIPGRGEGGAWDEGDELTQVRHWLRAGTMYADEVIPFFRQVRKTFGFDGPMSLCWVNKSEHASGVREAVGEVRKQVERPDIGRAVSGVVESLEKGAA